MKIHEKKIVLILILILLIVMVIQKQISITGFTVSEQLLDSSESKTKIEEYLQIKNERDYNDLKTSIEHVINKKKGKYSFYFEDLKTGSWTGVNEDSKFHPASLGKVSTLISILKKIETGQVAFDQKIIVREEDIDHGFGVLGDMGSNYEITVEELIHFLINESDNTASKTLRRIMNTDDLIHVRLGVGMPFENELKANPKNSPKEYANYFRSLYFSNFLKKPFADYAFSLMSETKFDLYFRSTIPRNIKISHKIGIWDKPYMFHDCGIVFVPEKEYFICVMSEDTTPDEATETMIEISSITYSFVMSNE